MFILTLSSYNSNDDNIEDLVGVFPSLEAIKTHIRDYWGNNNEDLSTFKLVKRVENDKVGVDLMYVSDGYVDNGWGGRYYYIYKVVT